MYKLVVLYPHPVDPVAFREYYESVHLPMAAKLPGLLTMRHSVGVVGAQDAGPFFAVWEGEFSSVEAMGEAMASEQGQALVADLPNYASGGAQIIHYAPVPTEV
ncbi:MAG: EthD family reductase [Mycobacteriaceae bacterium]